MESLWKRQWRISQVRHGSPTLKHENSDSRNLFSEVLITVTTMEMMNVRCDEAEVMTFSLFVFGKKEIVFDPSRAKTLYKASKSRSSNRTHCSLDF